MIFARNHPESTEKYKEKRREEEKFDAEIVQLNGADGTNNCALVSRVEWLLIPTTYNFYLHRLQDLKQPYDWGLETEFVLKYSKIVTVANNEFRLLPVWFLCK